MYWLRSRLEFDLMSNVTSRHAIPVVFEKPRQIVPLIATRHSAKMEKNQKECREKCVDDILRKYDQREVISGQSDNSKGGHVTIAPHARSWECLDE